ncbi:MAG: DUF3137 domain-containing protein [Alphaproteobacteria bacterium]|nr:DUF3137 domain-containing protein [Alphaproteobacteria bacterium]
MISKEKFIRKIQTEVFPQLLATEKNRRKALFWCMLWLLVASLFFIFGCRHYADVFSDKNKFTTLSIPIILCLCLTARIWHDFVHKQKRKFSPIFLKFLGKLNNKQTAINKSLLQHTCFFNHFDYITYDDCISGTFEKTQFSVAETKLRVYGKKHDVTIFQGVCIDIPMKIPVSGYTLLYNTKLPQKVPVLEQISLEDVSFCKNYQIYSDNQIDARVLLTPVFIEKLNNLKKAFHNKRIDVAFFGNHAVFIMRTWKNLFESYSLFRKITNIKTYEKFYDEIKAIHDMMKILSIDNKSIPATPSFNKKLYKKIFSQKEKRSNNFWAVSVFLVPIIIFIITAILCVWELGLGLALFAFILLGTKFLASRR